MGTNTGDCGNYVQEHQLNSSSDVVIGYSTNLLIDIPHSPAFPIQARNADNVGRDDEAMKPINEQDHVLENSSLPPIYVPVPYSVLGSMINPGIPRVQTPSFGNENKSRERMIPILDNLHIDQQRICPSTPLATPSIPIPNRQSSDNSQVQIFQFPDTTQSTVAAIHNDNSMSWIPQQTSRGFEQPQESFDAARSVFNYQTPRL